MEMPGGEYYIGDPCYVIDESLWSKFCTMIDDCDDGAVFEFEGHQVFVCSTNYGDGTYKDQMQRQYPVDAGIIGAIPIALISPAKVEYIQGNWEGDFGHRYTNPDKFIVSADSGRHREHKNINIGAVRIKT